MSEIGPTFGPTFRRRDAVDLREFEPLPYYAWAERPASVPLTDDEAATALYLAKGDLSQAAALLKVDVLQLRRLVRKNYPLQRIQREVRDP
jgi:hypothetical protein